MLSRNEGCGGDGLCFGNGFLYCRRGAFEFLFSISLDTSLNLRKRRVNGDGFGVCLSILDKPIRIGDAKGKNNGGNNDSSQDERE